MAACVRRVGIDQATMAVLDVVVDALANDLAVANDEGVGAVTILISPSPLARHSR